MDKQTSIELAELFLQWAEDFAARVAETGSEELIKRASVDVKIAKRVLAAEIAMEAEG
jgi:hypothetical protein